jgi:hypothetical protein
MCLGRQVAFETKLQNGGRRNEEMNNLVLKFDNEEMNLGKVEDFLTPPDSIEELAQAAGMREIIRHVTEAILYDAEQENPAVIQIEIQ